MEEDLQALLRAVPALAAVVGARVYWVRRPQGSEPPALVLRNIGKQTDQAMDGPSGLVSGRIEFSCLGADFYAAKALARLVETSLDGRALLGAATAFQGFFLLDERDDFDPEPPNPINRTTLDFMVWRRPL